MKSPVVLSALAIAATLLPAAALAQDASVRGPATTLQQETTRRRLLVRPDPPVARGFEDARRVADELAARRLAEETVAPPRAPQLDHDVTSAIQARGLQRALRR
jgi:hypothetical protein